MIEIRKLTQHSEFEAVVSLQRQIWGYADVELLPKRLFVVAEKIGGQVLGAFDSERAADPLVGFCLGIPGLKPGGAYYLHSHMLGVLPEYRNSGLGRNLKLQQRLDAIDRGIELIEWTFDPLELKNAYFNIQRLGCIVRRFVRNQYGSTSSHLHSGMPTDRCTAEWWIQSGRVERTLAGQKAAEIHPVASIAIPSDISKIRREDATRARQVQAKAAEEFEIHFLSGLAVTGFRKDENEGVYLFSEWPTN